ncbi:glucan endo-1,3-beta-glucosidase-like [Lycium ferocissimum]|uniref:glucan endo-1,3-beta-glucosidase-like n=1 Tax=Lycium ferocissimum TaxID=112874 RepID=UPI002814E5CA|nr:glucan endo-1,3-beta-glucosidase-like [Lycium ferocissimum]
MVRIDEIDIVVVAFAALSLRKVEALDYCVGWVVNKTNKVEASIGVCYGRVGTNLPPISEAINLIKSNGISRIRLFNPDPEALQPFYGTGIELLIGVPNEILPTLANNPVTTSIEWLQSNIFAHVSPNQVKYLVVGNEIFLKDPYYSPYIVPTITKLFQALQTLSLATTIKLSSSHASTILSNSYPPSSSTFDSNIKPFLLPLLQFLHDTGSPLMVNVYPFFSYINNPKYVSLDHALFRSSYVEYDQNLAYDNMFDASIDAFVYAMEKEGFEGIPVMVTETGWPTAGIDGASIDNAFTYNENIVRKALNNVGTPKRPGVGLDIFLFDLFDENGKSGEEFERHFGIFGDNGIKAYDIRFN